MFTTDTGVSTLILKEVPYKEIAYIRVQDVQPGGLKEHLEECIGFCRACGAERVYAAGDTDFEGYPHHCTVIRMALSLTEVPRAEDCLFPVTEETVGKWRSIYNEKMGPVDNSAVLTAFDEKEIVSSGGAYFVHKDGELLGIGWISGSEILAVAAAEPGAGERVMKALMSAMDTDRVTLDVVSTNRRAIRLYERMGFIPVQELRRWYTVR